MNTKSGQARLWMAGSILFILAAVVVLWPSEIDPEVPTSPIQGSAVTAKSRTPAPLPRREISRTATPRELRLSDLPPLPAPQRPPHPPGSTENEQWIAATTDALDTLAWEDDADSMRKILAELRSPLPEIRAAALNATLDFDDPTAIPYLRAISNDTADPLEQKEIADLIAHLELPSLIETLETE
jgi:hypothetical protein